MFFPSFYHSFWIVCIVQKEDLVPCKGRALSLVGLEPSITTFATENDPKGELSARSWERGLVCHVLATANGAYAIASPSP